MGRAEDRQARTVRVLLADDSPIFLKALRRFLGRQSEIVVVGEAHDGIEALELAQKLNPDLILLDLQMPNRSGIEIIGDLRHLVPDTRIIALSFLNWQQMSRSLGAHGCVSKPDLTDELMPTIYAVMAIHKEASN